jgi:hypothetical protein
MASIHDLIHFPFLVSRHILPSPRAGQADIGLLTIPLTPAVAAAPWRGGEVLPSL